MTTEFSEFENRRKFIRVSIYAITRYFCPLRDMEVGIQTRISNISEGGALLVTFSEGIPPESLVNMSFVMPGDESHLVTVEGKVKHTGIFEKDFFRSGIEFVKIKEKDRKAVRKLVHSKLKQT